MKTPAIPADEEVRHQVLQSLDIVYSPAEARFDRITRIAKRLFDVPIALISLVTSDSQWFKSAQGLTVSETRREISFCGHAILSDDVFVVPDALKDPDFADNPLVADEPKIRFYAGQPIKFDASRIGTLCIIDQRPRQLRPQQYDSLKCLAAWVESELLLRQIAENDLLQALLSVTEKKSLLDPLTGDLNQAGLYALREHLKAQSEGTEQPGSISIHVANLPLAADLRGQENVDSLRQEISQSVRVALNDRGLISSTAPNHFVIILANHEQGNAEIIAKAISEGIAATNYHAGFTPELNIKIE